MTELPANREQIVRGIAGLIDTRLTIEELQALQQRIRVRLEYMSRANIRMGQRVQFVGRYNRLEVGLVTGINPKTIQVKADSGRTWRVTPHLLSPEVKRAA